MKAILLDEVMKDPERPKKEHMIQFEPKSLRDMRGLMHHDISFQESVCLLYSRISALNRTFETMDSLFRTS